MSGPVPAPLPSSDPQSLRLTDLREDPGLYGILLEHASRGIRVQFLLRFALAAFTIAVVVAVPPDRFRIACDVVAGLYAVWAIVVAWLARRGDEVVIRRIWVALIVDVGMLVVLSVLRSPPPPPVTT